MATSFQEIFDECAFRVWEKQMRGQALFGESDWLLDTELGTITFGSEMVFPVQFLGTESDLTNSWLWADANERVAFPEASLQLCRKAREIGSKLGLEEFQNDTFAFVDEVGKPTSHTLAMVTISLTNASCYYQGNHENGSVFVAITDPRVDALPDLDKAGFIQAFNSLMWQPGDMRKRLVSYFSAKGCVAKDFSGKELKCRLATGEEIGLSFKPTRDGGMKINFCA